MCHHLTGRVSGIAYIPSSVYTEVNLNICYLHRNDAFWSVEPLSVFFTVTLLVNINTTAQDFL